MEVLVRRSESQSHWKIATPHMTIVPAAFHAAISKLLWSLCYCS